jgi:hypothetical protein
MRGTLKMMRDAKLGLTKKKMSKGKDDPKKTKAVRVYVASPPQKWQGLCVKAAIRRRNLLQFGRGRKSFCGRSGLVWDSVMGAGKKTWDINIRPFLS